MRKELMEVSVKVETALTNVNAYSVCNFLVSMFCADADDETTTAHRLNPNRLAVGI